MTTYPGSADDRKLAHRNAELESELRRMEKALAEAAALLKEPVWNPPAGCWGSAAGQMRTPANKLSPEER